MRLIDADALKDKLQNLAYDDWNQGVSTTWANAYGEVAEIVDQEPTADAVEVVLCKDCKWWKREENQVGEIGDDYFCAFDCNKSYREDYFCADGERKEE